MGGAGSISMATTSASSSERSTAEHSPAGVPTNTESMTAAINAAAVLWDPPLHNATPGQQHIHISSILNSSSHKYYSSVPLSQCLYSVQLIKMNLILMSSETFVTRASHFKQKYLTSI